MSAIDDVLAYAAECRTCRAEGRPLPVWHGGSLRRADLRGADLSRADLTGANLRGADLTGADLTGALIAEGTVTTHAAGKAGDYGWHALHTAEGVTVLQYGCERHPLAVWQARGPEYGARYGHDEAHWAVGPAVAIAAAVALGGAA